MTFKLKQNFLALTLTACAAAFAGCGSTSSKPIETAAAKPTATVETKTTETINKGDNVVETKTVTKETSETGYDGKQHTTTYESNTNLTASSADKIGVPECDDYIAKYEACVTGKVPEAARATMKSSIEQMRKSWKAVAEHPQAKASLAAGCKQAHEASKQSMSAYSCDW